MSEIGLYEAMSSLRAVRKLKPDLIPEASLERVLQAATWAPTGVAHLAKGDWRKRVIGRAIRIRTIVSAGWITEKLCMGVATRASKLVATDPEPEI